MENTQLTVGSLFSGIGGLDLGLERAGMRVIWQSEIEPFPSAVLKKHWPDVPNLGDITKIDWTQVERPDVICGGYPCQPFSVAGKRKGKADERHLWPFFADALRILRPRYAILENVPGHLSLGFGDVLGDLSELGYDAEWSTISARDVGAPHLRKRLFVVAHSTSFYGNGRGYVQHSCKAGQRENCAWEAGVSGGGIAANTMHEGLEGFRGERELRGAEEKVETCGLCWWSSEPDVGRVAYGVPDYVDRLKALGNAVVPQVSEVIGRIVVEAST